MNGKERVLAHLAGQPVDHLPLMPITMMFAADQIGAAYGRYATDYRVLVEAQLRTAEKYDLDYVSAISCPTREADDAGARVRYYEDQPPAIDEVNALLADKAALGGLTLPDPRQGRRMSDRIRAIEAFKAEVGDARLIEGWVEGPCAEAADLRGINRIMVDFIDDPAFVDALFDAVVAQALRFAQYQIEAGADIIGVGDAAASLAGPRMYEERVWAAEKRLVDGIHALGGRVRLHICGNTRKLLKGMGALGCEIVDLDFLTPVVEGRSVMGPDQVILGNIDPVRALRNSAPDKVTAAVVACHEAAGRRYIVGAGCEVPRDTPPENMAALCRYARENRP